MAYLAVFGVSAAALMGFIYAATVTFMERQVMATIEAEVQGLREQYDIAGLSGLIRTIEQRSSDERTGGVYLLRSLGGLKLAGNLNSWPEDVVFEEGGRISLKTNAGVPVLAQAFIVGGAAQLLVGRVIEDKRGVQALILQATVLGTALMLILGVVGGLVLSRWTLGRLESINRTTARIIGGDLGQRIAVQGAIEGGGDEFDELAMNLNAMLERIEKLVAGMREVTDNVAHDLRTPLSRMRSRIEVALLRPIDAEAAKALLEETVSDAETLIATFDALLNIAQAEAGERRASLERVDPAEICHDVVELYGPLAEDREIGLDLRTEANLDVLGNRHLLAQALANLVDNAIKHTPEGGRIEVTAAQAENEVVLSVTDDGPGIPPNLRDKALERFARLEPERSGPGNGLGLSLVKAVAGLHEAGLELDDNRPGLVVRLRMRAAPRRERAASAREDVPAGA